MNTKKDLINGYATTRRNIFVVEVVLKYRRATIEKLEALGCRIVDLGEINDGGSG